MSWKRLLWWTVKYEEEYSQKEKVESINWKLGLHFFHYMNIIYIGIQILIYSSIYTLFPAL